jgi:outer membrane receptor protein involved in Fe transport
MTVRTGHLQQFSGTGAHRMNKPGLLFAASLAALVLLVTSSPVAAQGVTTGAVNGVVTSEQGVPVESAQIQVTNLNTGFVATVATNVAGRYHVAGLEVGSNYRVTARRIGFRPLVKNDVVVTLGETRRVDFVLQQQVATLGEVTVSAALDPVINPTRQGTQSTVSDTLLRRLPTLNRNFTDFVALTPQVSTTLQNGGLSGGGTNNRYNNIKIDGTIETDLFGLGSTGQPGGQANGKSIGIESVKEYQVMLSPFDVRQGNFAGVLVNAVTKSGQNEFFGSAYGVTRNQSLVRSQDYLDDFKQTQYGVSLGGPIVRDRAFFFVNPEFQTRRVPAAGIYLGQPNVNLTSARVDSFTTLLSSYGLPAGTAGLVNNENPLTNVFVRFDFNLPRNSQLVLRHNYGRAEDDNFNRSASSFRLDDNAYFFESVKNAPAVQLRTLFSQGAYNELLVGLTQIRDKRAPRVVAPQISVTTPGYTLISGSERFSQGNELDQDVLELTENYSHPFGPHRFTIGTQNQWYKVRNLFTQASYGVWRFGSLDSLELGAPNQYIVGVPLSGDGAVRFNASNYSAYMQDEWTVNPNLNVTLGLRADIPVFNDKPPANAQVLEFYGRRTEEVPSGNIQWSPRAGFNWDVTGNAVNQLRGGLGLFTGRPAYVWLSNAFQNSGSVGVGVLTCNGVERSPVFNAATAANAPQTCADGATAAAGGEIDLLNKDLKFPQNLRATLAYDRRLTNRWIATFEGLYTQGINGLFYKNIALAGVADPSTVQLNLNEGGRWIYGLQPFAPITVPGGRSQIFDVENQSKDHAYNLTMGLNHRYVTNYEGSIYYTYSRAWDVQSFTSSTAFSQYRFGRYAGFNQAAKDAGTSTFEQRHRIVGKGTYTFTRTNTDLSIIYFGESGTPYGYVTGGDANGDGVSQNDPVYVPRNALDPNEMTFVSGSFGGVTYSPEEQAQAFENFVASTPCLNENRGKLLGRNPCRNPWVNTMNVSVRQSLNTWNLQRISLQLDVFNFLNLLNKDWGEQPTAGFGSSIVLLDQAGVTGGNLVDGRPTYRFNPGYQRFFSNNLGSNYQLQLQARYSF